MSTNRDRADRRAARVPSRASGLMFGLGLGGFVDAPSWSVHVGLVVGAALVLTGWALHRRGVAVLTDPRGAR